MSTSSLFSPDLDIAVLLPSLPPGGLLLARHRARCAFVRRTQQACRAKMHLDSRALDIELDGHSGIRCRQMDTVSGVVGSGFPSLLDHLGKSPIVPD